MELRAYHGDPKLKAKYMRRVKAHRKADEIVKGTYYEKKDGRWRMCAVGCTVHSGNHSEYETLLGIPRVLARLEDGIFESLPNELAMTWPERFLKAIKPGADLSKVWTKFAIWLLIDPDNGVLRFSKTQRATDSINKVANMYLRSLKEGVAVAEWIRVRKDASYAYAYAAAYAAYAASYSYAYAAADAAAAAYAATYAAADAAADARTKARIAQSEKLLELLKEAK